MDTNPPEPEIDRGLFAPSLHYQKTWTVEDGTIQQAPILAWNLGQGAYPRYQAIDGSVEIDNLPPKYAHLEDFQVLGLLELRERGGISADCLQANWPLIFTPEGFIHWYRRPLGRPGVLQCPDGKWYIAMVGMTYLLVGGGDPRARVEIDWERPDGDRFTMKDAPWISPYHDRYLQDSNENATLPPRQLLAPSDIELDLTKVHWPTIIDITRMPGSMRSALLMGATDRLSDGFVDAGKTVIELINEDWDKKDPFKLTIPETYARAQTIFNSSSNPILYSEALFDGRLEIIRAEQWGKEDAAAAERYRERLARSRRKTTIQLQRELRTNQTELTATKQELATAKARIRQYEQALDALFQSRETIRKSETDETAMHD